MNQIEVLMFDLGGVVVELTGVQTMIEWAADEMGVEELWRRWLSSPAVRAFETGATDADTFAADMVREFGLSVEPGEFLEAFRIWPGNVYAGAHDLLQGLAPQYRLACFSNTNALHWPRMRDEFGLGERFHHHFLSHEIGKLKPDVEAFHHIVEELAIPPASILFLDDNQMNVEGAREAGLQAYRVHGAEGAALKLGQLGLL